MQRCYHEEISKKNNNHRFTRFREQSLAETKLKIMIIQYKQFLERQLLVLSTPEDLLLFLTIRIKNMAVWKITFVSDHLKQFHQS